MYIQKYVKKIIVIETHFRNETYSVKDAIFIFKTSHDQLDRKVSGGEVCYPTGFGVSKKVFEKLNNSNFLQSKQSQFDQTYFKTCPTQIQIDT